MSQATSSLRVPFGQRDGRMWSAQTVATGLACGCRCPECDAPLVCRNAGRYRRAHFAHHNHLGCAGGYETAIHKMAKQLIVDRGALLLPAWDGSPSMPNPPTLADAAGAHHRGATVDAPSRRALLSEAVAEQSRSDYRPDVVAKDEQGELLIEIRVSHAVGDLKTRRVQSEGRRMMEIDLSKVTQEEAADDACFEALVLDAATNRQWVSFPEVTDAWRRSFADLKEYVRLRNLVIEEQRNEQARLAAQRAEEVACAQARKDARRQWLRAPHETNLARLESLTVVDAVKGKLASMQQRDEPLALQNLAHVTTEFVRRHLLTFSEEAWAYEAHPWLWQTAAYLQFIEGRPAGHAFSQVELGRWVRNEFGVDRALWLLFHAQEQCRKEARQRGKQLRVPWAWYFTDQENRRIPNFWKPINGFVDRLVHLGVVVHDRHRYERILVL